MAASGFATAEFGGVSKTQAIIALKWRTNTGRNLEYDVVDR